MAAAAAIADQANALRRGQGLGALAPETRLAQAATAFAAWMAETDRYGHEADGRTPAQRAQARGYADCAVGENIAWRYSSAGFTAAGLADGFFQGWAASPPHRRNLLDSGFTETGIGIARSKASGRHYAVQLFGRPQSLRVTLQVANEAGAEFGYDVDGQRFRLAPRTTRTHTVCGAGVVTLQEPGGADTARRWQAQDGSRLTVRRHAGGAWKVDVR